MFDYIQYVLTIYQNIYKLYLNYFDLDKAQQVVYL